MNKTDKELTTEIVIAMIQAETITADETSEPYTPSKVSDYISTIHAQLNILK